MECHQVGLVEPPHDESDLIVIQPNASAEPARQRAVTEALIQTAPWRAIAPSRIEGGDPAPGAPHAQRDVRASFKVGARTAPTSMPSEAMLIGIACSPSSNTQLVSAGDVAVHSSVWQYLFDTAELEESEWRCSTTTS